MIVRRVLIFLLLFLTSCTAVAQIPHAMPIEGGAGKEPAQEAQTISTPLLPTATSGPATEPANLAELEDYGLAPELTNSIWLNVDHPLRLADLRGKVVLLDMWTFG